MKIKTVICDEIAIKRAISRISHEIVEHNKGTDNICIVGIKTRGVPLAERISKDIESFEGKKLPTGVLDISLYRDDLTEIAEMPTVNGTEINFDIKGKDIILCDDVLFTGRTVRAAIEALIKIGRPSTIQLAILVDRGHRELPIRADYVGKNIPTSLNEMIAVKFKETDKTEDSVYLLDKE